jgi:outer membrane protein assembly factor BamB
MRGIDKARQCIAGRRSIAVRRRLTVGILVSVCAASATAVAGSARATAAVSDDWTMFHRDQLHQGVSPDTFPGASTASTLSLKWKTLVPGSTSGLLGSPAVVYNAHWGVSLVYEASQGTHSTLMAINATTGAVVWSTKLTGSVRDSPAVSGNTVYVASHDQRLYAFDATFGGAPLCTYTTTGMIESSPVVGNVDGTGDVVFFGDIGQGEKVNAGHEWAINGVGNSNGQCTLKWSFNGFAVTTGGTRTGSWSSPALAQDANGRWLDVFGSTNPDNAVYALDATTGAEVWHFTTTTKGDSDVGAGPTISPPGNNGFADGVVYIDGKNQVEYALDLKTGALIWQFNLKKNAGTGAKAICTAALVGNQLIVTYNQYVYDFNATSGTLTWRSAATGTADFIASPAISGAPGNQVIVAGDLAGTEHAYSLATGSQVFAINVGKPIFSSSAIVGGMVFFASLDGNVYALG